MSAEGRDGDRIELVEPIDASPFGASDEEVAECLSCAIGAGLLPTKGGVHGIGPDWLLNAEHDRSGRPRLILQTRRHVEDLESLSASEASALGPIVAATVAHMKRTFGAQRIYLSSISETEPAHVHLRLIARFADDPSELRGVRLFGAPMPVTYDGPVGHRVIEEIADLVRSDIS